MTHKEILVFGASNSKYSINKALATFAASQLPDADINLLDLNDFEMPIYSIDRQLANGFPALAQQFLDHILAADGIIISFAEHNGMFAVAYKNIYDWMSRIDRNIYGETPMLLMATSPGGRGGKGVLQTALDYYGRTNPNVIEGGFSLPKFKQHFDAEQGISDPELRAAFELKLQEFIEVVWG